MSGRYQVEKKERELETGNKSQEDQCPAWTYRVPPAPTPPDGIRLRNWLLGKSVPLSQQEVWRNERAAVKVHDSQVTQPGFGSAS